VPVFQSPDELYKILGGFLEQVVTDPQIGPKFSGAGLTVLINYTDPDTTILLDCTQNPPQVTCDPPAGTAGEFKMTMSADDGHKFWQGKFNVALALAKKQVKVEGPLPKMMKLLPAMQPAYAKYKDFLQANGRADLVA
jgi:putative sterol carrier protein